MDKARVSSHFKRTVFFISNLDVKISEETCRTRSVQVRVLCLVPPMNDSCPGLFIALGAAPDLDNAALPGSASMLNIGMAYNQHKGVRRFFSTSSLIRATPSEL